MVLTVNMPTLNIAIKRLFARLVTLIHNTRGQVTNIRENGATSGAGVLARYIYDDQGRRLAVQRGNGHWTYYGHDDVNRLTSIAQVPVGGPSSDHLTLSFEYNPAGQITRRERSSTAYDWDIDNLETYSFINNGLNQAISMYDGTSTDPITYDNRGNLTSHSGKTYDYDIFNKLTSVSGTSAQSGTMINVTYKYDSKGRLLEENDAETQTITRFAYSGTQLISEFNTSNTVQRRYVHGPGVDEPIVVYEGSGTANKSWMMADHQGSIIGYTNASGAVTNKNTYSMEGVPGDNNVGRFGYTGQMWLEGAELYHYKARAYDPQLGRFLQPDPIGYGDGLNMYAYVGGDALNSRDPSGTTRREPSEPRPCPPGTSPTAGCGKIGKKRREIEYPTWLGGSISMGDFRSGLFGLGGSHVYIVVTVICANASALSEEQRKNIIMSYTRPSVNPQPAEDGSLGTVTTPNLMPLIGSPVLGGGVSGFFPIPGGQVRTTFTPDGLQGRNTTTALHPLHSGVVDRSIVNNNGMAMMLTIGRGSNYLGVIAALNVTPIGIPTFKELDQRLVRNVTSGIEGCDSE